jgi:hypothetical protein
MKLDPKAFGLTLAILCSAFWFILMTLALLTGFLQTTVIGVGTLHPFFTYSWTGLIYMIVQHFIYGFVGGWLIGWLYNKLAK